MKKAEYCLTAGHRAELTWCVYDAQKCSVSALEKGWNETVLAPV